MVHNLHVYVLRFICSALGNPTAEDGKFLKSFDVDANNGRGAIETTDNPAEAMRFPNQIAGHQCWTTQSRKVPIRPDGKPNRPLTAYTVEIIPLEQA